MLLLSFSEKETETSSGTKNSDRSLCCVQSQKSQDSSPRLGWAALSTAATVTEGLCGRVGADRHVPCSFWSRLVRCKSSALQKCAPVLCLSCCASARILGVLIVFVEVLYYPQKWYQLTKSLSFTEVMILGRVWHDPALSSHMTVPSLPVGYSHLSLPIKAPAIHVHFW